MSRIRHRRPRPRPLWRRLQRQRDSQGQRHRRRCCRAHRRWTSGNNVVVAGAGAACHRRPPNCLRRGRAPVMGWASPTSVVTDEPDAGNSPRSPRATGSDSEGEAEGTSSSSSSSYADSTAPAPGSGTIGEALSTVVREVRQKKSSSSSSSSSATYAAALVALVAIHVRDPGWGIWNVIRVIGSLILGGGLAYKVPQWIARRIGAIAAAGVGWGTLYAGPDSTSRWACFRLIRHDQGGRRGET